MISRRSNMYETLMKILACCYFENARELYTFILSIATGFFIFIIGWLLASDRIYSPILFVSLFFGVWFYINNRGKYMAGEDSSASTGSKKQRARRDNDDNDPSTEEADESMDCSEDKSRTHSPVALEPPRKSCRRPKKKRNFLKSNKSKYKAAMDDSSETSSNNDSYPKIETRVEKTKVYSPLSQYLRLNLEVYDLYYEFKPYLLELDQLKMYGFPQELPDHPGHITTDPKLVKGSTQRRCCRCGKSFYILSGSQYKADSCCLYHPRKQVPYHKDNPYSGSFPCCDGNYMSEGCVTWQYHVSAESFLHDVEFVKTRSKRHLNAVTACSVYALDCEMLFTTAGMEVAKVGIVGVDGLTVYESFVLPQNPVLDYNTLYSGVSEKDLKGVLTTLADVQAYLLKLLNKDTILVGHGLENDLKALRLIHENIVDTSVAFPLPHTKVYKKSLRVLAKEFLNKNIQQSLNGHDCIEDARTCMELMLLKISRDLQTRLPFTQDENRNISPSFVLPSASMQNYLSYSCNYSYSSNSFADEFYSGFYMPKKYYQKSCIY